MTPDDITYNERVAPPAFRGMGGFGGANRMMRWDRPAILGDGAQGRPVESREPLPGLNRDYGSRLNDGLPVRDTQPRFTRS